MSTKEPRVPGARTRALLCVAITTATFAVAGCGGTETSSSGADATKKTAGASGLTLADTEKATGTVTFCGPKDISGINATGLKRFNEQFAAQGLKARLVEFPEGDQQRTQFIQRQQAKSPECDIFDASDEWLAEFVSQGWLEDLTAYIATRKDEFIPATLKAGNIEGRQWSVPFAVDSGLIYYRTDQVDSAPKTWQDLYSQAAQTDGVTYQGAAYEGLTCNFLEVALSAGGEVLSPDGKKSAIDSPQNLAALKLMSDGVQDGAAIKGVTTYQEEEARRSFENGRASFERNWPYAYALGQKAPKIKGKFDVAPLPAFEEGGKAVGILGIDSYVMSEYSKNKEGALKLIDFLTTPETFKVSAIKHSRTPPLTALFDDPAVRKAIPFADDLRAAIENGAVRPRTPVYPLVSAAIFKNVNEALSGNISPEDALKNADEQINKALATF
jgi:multiple sugar transport system substrate-binding protein